MDSLINIDIYELIGVTQTATVQEIKKAYRKKALSCHPDKNPNNPKAAELFHELSHVLEILTDASAREAYDKVLVAKQQAKVRASQLNSKRKKLKEDLEAREEAYKRSLNPQSTAKTDEDRLRAEIERLQKEGSKQVEEEIALVKQRVRNQTLGSYKESQVDDYYRIAIKWKINKNNVEHTYDYDSLHKIFSKYGDITEVVVSSSTKGRALVEFRNRSDAEIAVSTEIGYVENPLKLQKLWAEKSANFSGSRTQYNPSEFNERVSFLNQTLRNEINAKHSQSTSNYSQVDRNEMSDAEFERSVLNNLKRAQERKRTLENSNIEKTT